MAFSVSIAQRAASSPWNLVVEATANQYGVDPNLIRAIIATESAWIADAVNPSDPSYGLMQVLQGSRGWYPSYTAEQLLDPATNISLGTQIVRSLISQWGSTSDALSAYNAGHPSRVTTGGYTNQAYVDSVQTYWTWYINNPVAYDENGQPIITPDSGDVTGISTLAIIALVSILAMRLARA